MGCKCPNKLCRFMVMGVKYYRGVRDNHLWGVLNNHHWCKIFMTAKNALKLLQWQLLYVQNTIGVYEITIWGVLNNHHWCKIFMTAKNALKLLQWQLLHVQRGMRSESLIQTEFLFWALHCVHENVLYWLLCKPKNNQWVNDSTFSIRKKF